MASERPHASGPEALHAPWRLEYLEAEDAKEKKSGPPAVGSGSFLMDYWLDSASDERNGVIVRMQSGLQAAAGSFLRQWQGEGAWDGPGGMILLNKFPYANGHLLVAISEARGRLVDYTAAERAALWRLTDLAAELLERTLKPQGINVGVNQGRAAGAGVPQHLHVHLVPRWGGDVNYMTAIGGVRVIPAALEAMARRFRATWAAMTATG